MRCRSKQLWKYLQDTGALATGDPVVIDAAKKAYRKLYKAEWKRNRKQATASKELRPIFNPKQYEALLLKSRLNGYKNPTGYLKEIALASLNGERNVVPFKEKLVELLQTITIAGHALNGIKTSTYHITSEHIAQVETLIKQSEQQLIEYLYLR